MNEGGRFLHFFFNGKILSHIDKFGAHQRRHQIPLKSYSYNGFGPERLQKNLLGAGKKKFPHGRNDHI